MFRNKSSSLLSFSEFRSQSVSPDNFRSESQSSSPRSFRTMSPYNTPTSFEFHNRLQSYSPRAAHSPRSILQFIDARELSQKETQNLLLEYISENPYRLQEIPENYRTEEQIIKACLINYQFACLMPKRLKKDQNFAKELVSLSGRTLEYFHASLFENIDIVIQAVSQCPDVYLKLPKIVKAHFLVIQETLAAKNLSESCLMSIVENLPDLEILADELEEKETPLSEKALFIESVLIKVLSLDGMLIEKLPRFVSENSKFALTAVKNNPWALEFVGAKNRSDKVIVLAAIEKQPYTLQFAGSNLKENRDLVTRAADKSPRVFKFASKNMKGSSELALRYVKKDGQVLKYLSEELKDNKRIVKEAVKQDGEALQYASERLKSDLEIIAQAAKKDDCSIIPHIPKLDPLEYYKFVKRLSDQGLCASSSDEDDKLSLTFRPSAFNPVEKETSNKRSVAIPTFK